VNAFISPSQIPLDVQDLPWFRALVKIFQEQAKVVQEQAEQIATLKKTVQELRDEIGRLKKMPKRPKFRPGGGDPKGRSGKPGNAAGSGESTSANRMAPQKIQQEIRIPAVGVPEGSRFKGYQDYTVQELEMISKDVTYRLEVWQTPDGTVVRALLPLEVQGSHFGHQLRAFLHNLYALGMTEPGLFDLLKGAGIEVSEGQVHNILMGESEGYHKESEKILTAGLEEAPYIWTDDTGAKHQLLRKNIQISPKHNRMRFLRHANLYRMSKNGFVDLHG
jgi:hypothetical protein